MKALKQKIFFFKERINLNWTLKFPSDCNFFFFFFDHQITNKNFNFAILIKN